MCVRARVSVCACLCVCICVCVCGGGGFFSGLKSSPLVVLAYELLPPFNGLIRMIKAT